MSSSSYSFLSLFYVVIFLFTACPAHVEAASYADPALRKALFECESRAAQYTRNIGKQGDKEAFDQHVQECMEVTAPQKTATPFLVSNPGDIPPTPAGMRSLVFTNSTNETIWVGGSGVGMKGIPTGFELAANTTKVVTVAAGTRSMAFWPRTGCVKKDLIESRDGKNVVIGQYLYCATGDCYSRAFWSKDIPAEQCNGGTRQPPVSAFEIDFGQGSSNDFWDLTNVDGWSMGITVKPLPGRSYPVDNWDKKQDKRFNCGSQGASCVDFDMKKCPVELRSADGKSCWSISKAVAYPLWRTQHPKLKELFFDSEAKIALMGCTCSTTNNGTACEAGGASCLYGCSPFHLTGYDASRPGEDTDWLKLYPNHGGFCDYRGSSYPANRWPTPDDAWCKLNNVADKDCTYEKAWCKSAGIAKADCNYPDLFKSICNDAYSFQYNDNSSTFQCKQKSDYSITFSKSGK